MVKKDKVMLRCAACRAINKVAATRLKEGPKCGKCKSLLTFPKDPVWAKGATFEKEVLDWPGLVLIEFSAAWCGHCRTFKPVLEGFARDMAGIIKVVVVDVDDDPHLAQSYNVKATPTLVLYDNGTKVDMITGAFPRERLEAWIDSVLSL